MTEINKHEIKTIDESEVENLVNKKCQKLETLFKDYENFNKVDDDKTTCYDYEFFGTKDWFKDFKSFNSDEFDKIINEHNKIINKNVLIPINQKTVSGAESETTMDKIIAIDLHYEKLNSMLTYLNYMKDLYESENNSEYTIFQSQIEIDITLFQRRETCYFLLRKALVYLDKLENLNRLDCAKNGIV